MRSNAPLPVVTDVLALAVRRLAAITPVGPRFDPDRVIVAGLRGRRGPHGKRAACHFTRFPTTKTTRSADGRFELPRLVRAGVEARYLVVFVLPRFLLLSPREQRQDVIHELLHMDPAFSGLPSTLRHGRAYDARVHALERAAEAQGIEMPPLPGAGELAYYRRFRPMPRAIEVRDRRAPRVFDAADLELAVIELDASDLEAAPPRFLYVCPACSAEYPRRRRIRAASSCSRCAPRFDPRFELRIATVRAD